MVTRRLGPTRLPCDMALDCPRAWLVMEVRDSKGLVLDSKRTCRRHATVAINHLLTLGTKVEMRVFR